MKRCWDVSCASDPSNDLQHASATCRRANCTEIHAACCRDRPKPVHSEGSGETGCEVTVGHHVWAQKGKVQAKSANFGGASKEGFIRRCRERHGSSLLYPVELWDWCHFRSAQKRKKKKRFASWMRLQKVLRWTFGEFCAEEIEKPAGWQGKMWNCKLTMGCILDLGQIWGVKWFG